MTRELTIPYSTWKSVDDSNSWPNYYVEKADGYHVVTGHKDFIFVSWATGSDETEFENNRKSSATSAASIDDAIARIIGVSVKAVPQNPDGSLRVQSDPRRGSKVQIYSHNFTKKTTWMTTAVERLGQAMSSGDGGTTYTLDGGNQTIIDVSHGHVAFEAKHADKAPVIYVDAVAKVEDDPDGTQHDYSMDYNTGTVTFHVSQTGTVTADFHEVQDSHYLIEPAAGKRLTIVEAELQFSRDLSMRSDFSFSVRALVDKHPALAAYWDANGGPYPAGTKLPLQTNTYRTVLDVVAEANRSYPVIQKTTNPSPTWRDLADDVNIYCWEYDRQAVIELYDKWGMDVNIWVGSDVPPDGSYAVCTFYGISEDE